MKNRFTDGLARLWWLPLLTGLLSIIFGIWVLAAPAESLPVLAYVFAACMLGVGMLNLSYSVFSSGRYSNWGWSMALGILEIVAGVWLFSLPTSLLTVTFVYIVGIWILVVAINSLCEATALSMNSSAWLVWMVILLLAVMFFAILFLSNPVFGGIVSWIYIGVSFILFGCYRMSLAFAVRKLGKAFDL